MSMPGAGVQLIWNNRSSRGYVLRSRRGMRQRASTTSHSDIRGLRRFPGVGPHDRASSGENAVYCREFGERGSPVA